MPRPHAILSEAENDYPNRFPSVAQVCPVSSGHTIASVRSEDEDEDGRHILRNVDGFYIRSPLPLTVKLPNYVYLVTYFSKRRNKYI